MNRNIYEENFADGKVFFVDYYDFFTSNRGFVRYYFNEVTF